MTKSNKVYVTQQGTAVAVELAPYGPIGPLRVLIMVTLYDFNQNVAQNDTCEPQKLLKTCIPQVSLLPLSILKLISIKP